MIRELQGRLSSKEALSLAVVPCSDLTCCALAACRYVFDADVNDAHTITVPRLDGFRIDVAGIR
jgi:hypothetical protein